MKRRSVLLAPLTLLILAVLVLGACTGQAGGSQPETEAQSTESIETGELPETGGTETFGESSGTETPSGAEEASVTPESVSHGNEVGGYVELVDALRGAGATVEPAGQVEQEFFGPVGQLIKVNGVDVQVFEYPDETAQKSDADKISADGSTIGTSMITWVDQPNFWARDRVIVLYVGKDHEMINQLTDVLGESITTH